MAALLRLADVKTSGFDWPSQHAEGPFGEADTGKRRLRAELLAVFQEAGESSMRAAQAMATREQQAGE